VHHESSPADPRRLRLYERQDHLGGNGGIDGAAAVGEDVMPGFCCQRMRNGDHEVFGRTAPVRIDIDAVVARGQSGGHADYQYRGEKQTRWRRRFSHDLPKPCKMMVNVSAPILDIQTSDAGRGCECEWKIIRGCRAMMSLLREHFVIVLLVLFAGVLFWAFRPRKNNQSQILNDDSSSSGEDSR